MASSSAIVTLLRAAHPVKYSTGIAGESKMLEKNEGFKRL
jgi:hypothetical protein